MPERRSAVDVAREWYWSDDAFDRNVVASLAALIERERAVVVARIADALLLDCPCCEAAWNETHATDCTYAMDCPNHNARRNDILRALQEATK